MEPTMLGDGRYELAGLLGRGGMAEVRKARDLRLGRTVAIKRLRADLASDSTFQARFRREAQSAASLNHPAVVAVYDTGVEPSADDSGLMLPYIVMEYVEGRTLRDILREGRKILPDRALEITGSVLDALDYSHRAGIIHRDIKPANVMLTPAGDVKVMDFGIARAIADSSSTMTQTAAVVGTAQYLSPEQARGEQVDARSDLYSTGCLLFELLTGRPPFIGDSPVSVAYQHVREEPTAPSSIDPEISAAIDAITLKALSKPVDDRYQSAAQMRADIDRALRGQVVLAPAVPGAASFETEHFLPPVPPAADPTRLVPVGAHRDEPPATRRTWLWALLLLLLAAAVIAALIVVPKLMAADPVPQSDVPRLLNLTVAQAKQRLENAGLLLGDPEVTTSASVAKGHILSQSETPGEPVDEGTAVDVVVSGGRQTATVPFVTDGNLATATQKLEEVKLKVNAIADEDSTARRNQVTSTDPVAGTTLPVGFVVDVHYSTGYIEVPSVVGSTQRQAIKVLEDRGFQVVPSSVESDLKAGTVTAQDPGAGLKRPYGDTILISVSLGPQETPTATQTETPPTETTPTETTPTETTPTETTTTETTTSSTTTSSTTTTTPASTTSTS
ncbi:MAG: Stk1 family PASTA domain-containing Ser/Thr kinase [Nocardioidaceae bacterium]